MRALLFTLLVVACAHRHRLLLPHRAVVGDREAAATLGARNSCMTDAAACVAQRAPLAPLVTADDSFWTATFQVNNPLYNRRPPLFVVQPTNENDVLHALQCAAQSEVQVAVKSGGHNYAGFSQAEPSGFQIDMRAYLCYIRNATVEFGQPAIRVGAGCTFETVYTWLQSQSSPDYVLSGGFCPSVGVSGFVLSGGIGPLTRLFGMGVDQILEARMATVNGSSIVVANATINTDVYWALRGGGGGSFGVVTEWALKLHSLKDQHHFTYGEYCPPDGLASYNASLQQLARVLPTVPDWLTLSWRFTNAPNTPAYGLCYLYYGINSADTTYNWLVQSGLVPTATSPLLHYPGGHDINGDGSAKGHNGNFVTDYPTFLEMELANAEFKGYMQFSTYPAITHNCALSSFTQATIDALLAVWTAIPNGTLVSCDFQGLPLSQGAAGKVASSETAFEWRNFPYAADAECSWQTRAGEQAAKSWLDTFLPALQSIGQCPGSYLNFPWRGVPNFPQQYWGANTARLQQIRAVWNSDPKNSLRFEQQVPLP